jgi:hypothetical protein
MGWWILWLPVVVVLLLRRWADRYGHDDIDDLIEWEKEHWNQ